MAPSELGICPGLVAISKLLPYEMGASSCWGLHFYSTMSSHFSVFKDVGGEAGLFIHELGYSAPVLFWHLWPENVGPAHSRLRQSATLWIQSELQLRES